MCRGKPQVRQHRSEVPFIPQVPAYHQGLFQQSAGGCQVAFDAVHMRQTVERPGNPQGVTDLPRYRQAALVQLSGRRDIALAICQHRRHVERLGVRHSGCNVFGIGAGHQRQSVFLPFSEIASKVPEVKQCARHSQPCFNIPSARLCPAKDLLQVVMVGLQCVQPLRLSGPDQLGFGRLGELHVIGCVSLLNLLGFPTLLQLFQCVLVYSWQHRKARLALGCFFLSKQALVQ